MTYTVKGWCPGALRPMESGDGLIVRVRPWNGALTVDQARGVAEAAARHGSGLLDLTRRANLQLRGVAPGSLAALQEALLDRDAQAEAARNVMVGPFAGAEARRLAGDLAEAIVADSRLHALPAKFGWLVDDGAFPTLLDQRADIALCLLPQGVAVRARGQWLGTAERSCAVAAAIDLALGHPPPLAAPVPLPAVRRPPPGIAAPFGRLTSAHQLPMELDLVIESVPSACP